MVNEGDSRDSVPHGRRVLGDVTNNHGKRPFLFSQPLFVSGNDTYPENAKAGADESKFKGLSCETWKGRGSPNAKRRSLHAIYSVERNNIRENAGTDILHSSEKSKDLSTLQLIDNSVIEHNKMKEARSSRRSCLSFVSVNESENILPESEDESQENRSSTYFSRHDTQSEKGHDTSSTLSDDGMNFAVLEENKVHSGNTPTKEMFGKPCPFGYSSTSASFDIEMESTERQYNSHATSMGNSSNVKNIIGSDETCSCSFCLKAAYMWADLHYQDTRGRLAALKKSRRHARSLEGKVYNLDQTSIIDRDNSEKSTELKFDLMQRCRSLFLHTEDALVRETAELHSNLVKLKDLRENCKGDLEINTGSSSDKK